MRACLLLLGLLVAAPLSADRIPVGSRITDVTVYADRARITRSAEVSIPAGDHLVVLSGLPVGLQDESLQAGATADGALSLRGVEVRSVFAAQSDNPRFVTLREELEAVDQTIASLNAQLRDNRERREFMNAIRSALAGGKPGEGRAPVASGASDIAELFAFYSNGLAELTEREEELQLELKEIQPVRKALEAEIERIRASGRTTTKQAEVAFSSEAPRSASVQISYTIGNASWRPLYRARANLENGNVQLEMQGEVRQATGEDWENVQLVLSTARPSEGSVMPELDPRWLRILRPMPAAESSRAVTSSYLSAPAAAKAVAADAMQEVVVEEALPDFATIENTGLSVTYRIPSATTIPSDNEPQQVPVAALQLEAAFDYAATPVLSEAAYLRAKVTNSTDATILPGEVMLFREGEFVGNSEVELTAPGEEFDFWLGIDDSIRVTTKLLVDKAGDRGLIRKRESLERKREFEIENFRDSQANIEVFAQVPVSQDEEIVVNDPRFSLKPDELDTKTGEISWRLTLDPNKKQTWTMEYSIEWPQGENVLGL